MSRARLGRLQRLQQRLESARRYQPTAAMAIPFPEFAEWATALSAELYAAAGMHRDNALLDPLSLDLRGLHEVFTNARWFFVRNHGREPSFEEWVFIMEAAEECREYRSYRPSSRRRGLTSIVTSAATRSAPVPDAGGPFGRGWSPRASQETRSVHFTSQRYVL
jgi:hypothetical protein